jgi:hypothetical protein
MVRPAFFLPTAVAGALLLTGCDKPENGIAAPGFADAAIVDALADPIMSDLALSTEKHAHCAISVKGRSCRPF